MHGLLRVLACSQRSSGQEDSLKKQMNATAPSSPAPEVVHHLLDLPADLLRNILDQLVSDELALLRAGATCKAMRAMATSPELWCTALLAFFDGELPPALASLEWRQRPLQLLREQVLCARRLSMVELSLIHISEPTRPY